MNLIEKVFGTHSERELKLIRPIVAPCKRRDAGRPPAGGICNRA